MARKGVSYIEHDVSTDLKARDEMVRKSGQLGVPVIVVDESVVVGFNRARLDALLGG